MVVSGKPFHGLRAAQPLPRDARTIHGARIAAKPLLRNERSRTVEACDVGFRIAQRALFRSCVQTSMSSTVRIVATIQQRSVRRHTDAHLYVLASYASLI